MKTGVTFSGSKYDIREIDEDLYLAVLKVARASFLLRQIVRDGVGFEDDVWLMAEEIGFTSFGRCCC